MASNCSNRSTGKANGLYHRPDLETIRQRRQQQLDALHPAIQRFDHPHRYPVGLEKTLYERKTDLVLKARNVNHDEHNRGQPGGKVTPPHRN